MSDPNRIPPVSGVQQFAYLVAKERIVREDRYLAIRATMRGSAPLPMPPGAIATAKDLRRGRMRILGRVLWFLGILKERNHPDARELAERLRDLVSEAIDLELPKVIVATEPVRVWRPAVPMQGLRVVRAGRNPGEGTSGRGVA